MLQIIFIGFLLISGYCNTQEKQISAVEDLMQEHGLLNRVLLIYEECVKKLRKHEFFDRTILSTSAYIIKDFIENYHEKLEEQYVFPVLEKARRYTGLVTELRKQHNQGRVLTQIILKYSNNPLIYESPRKKKKMVNAIEAFIHMYRAHEAREDTQIFPQFHALITQQEYKRLSILFDKFEEEKFGEHGYERMLEKVMGIEKVLGIHDLAHYSPKLVDH